MLALGLFSFTTSAAIAQTDWDPNAIRYGEPSGWQQAAVAALLRHLPADSGYSVLGPIDLDVDLPDTTDLVRTTLRILAPDPRSSRNLTRRLWYPTGGVALEELQPSDTLIIPHALPPGYSGRFLKGTVAGRETLVQAFTVQEHRWLLWAQRAEIAGITEEVTGPIARYAGAVRRYLAAVDSGLARQDAPRAAEFGLDPFFDLYAAPPPPVVRDRSGYLRLLAENETFSLDGDVRDVDGFVPGPPLVIRLQAGVDSVLFPNKDGERALQGRYREYSSTGGRWVGMPVLNARTITGLRPGRYIYITDRYGVIRVARAPAPGRADGGISAALIAHGEPLRAAGELVIALDDGTPRVTVVNMRSEEYFFSNLSLTLYEDVEERSDRYVAAVGHVLSGLDLGRLPTENILIRKF